MSTFLQTFCTVSGKIFAVVETSPMESLHCSKEIRGIVWKICYKMATYSFCKSFNSYKISTVKKFATGERCL